MAGFGTSFSRAFRQALPAGIQAGTANRQLGLKREMFEFEKTQAQQEAQYEKDAIAALQEMNKKEGEKLQNRTSGRETQAVLMQWAAAPKSVRQANKESMKTAFKERFGIDMPEDAVKQFVNMSNEELTKVVTYIGQQLNRNPNLGGEELARAIADPLARIQATNQAMRVTPSAAPTRAQGIKQQLDRKTAKRDQMLGFMAKFPGSKAAEILQPQVQALTSDISSLNSRLNIHVREALETTAGERQLSELVGLRCEMAGGCTPDQKRMLRWEMLEEERQASITRNQTKAALERSDPIPPVIARIAGVEPGITRGEWASSGRDYELTDTEIREFTNKQAFTRTAITGLEQLAQQVRTEDGAAAITAGGAVSTFFSNLSADMRGLARALGPEAMQSLTWLDPAKHSSVFEELGVQRGIVRSRLISLAYARALTQNPDGRISGPDVEFALRQLGGNLKSGEAMASVLLDVAVRVDDEWRRQVEARIGHVPPSFLSVQDMRGMSLDELEKLAQ